MNDIFKDLEWTELNFSDLADNISERVDPSGSSAEIYVGLEHLDPDDIYIHRHGSPSDVKGTKLKVKQGDVIFGKRRAYQRKAAVADFDGICSAHAMVLRAKSENVLPKFLPYFMHTDVFMDRAVMISEGSLSPTIKWSTLSKQSFLIPPIEIQQIIVDLLSSADESIQSKLELKKRLEKLSSAITENIGNSTHGCKLVKVSDVARINKESLTSKTDHNYEFSYLDIASILGPKRIGKLKKIKFKDAPSRAKRIVKDNNILLSLVRPYQQSFAKIEVATDIIASTGIAVIEPKVDVSGDYIYHTFFSNRFLLYCKSKMTGTNYPAITPGDIKDYTFYLPESIKDQQLIADKLNKIDSTINQVEKIIKQEQQIKKIILSRMVGK